MKKAQGVVYWARWITSFRKWLQNTPMGLDSELWFEVKDVDYEDLAAIAKNENVLCHSEDSRHRQWVQLDLPGDVTLTFYSPERPFYYAPL